MSAVGIGLAWVAMAAAAFMVLSATAPKRNRDDLEADPESHGRARGPHPRAQTDAMEVYPHWPQVTHTTTALRSSPSAAYMQSTSPSRPYSVRSGPLGLR